MRMPWPAGLLASAQLGLPAGVVSLGLTEHVLTAGQGAAIVASALIMLGDPSRARCCSRARRRRRPLRRPWHRPEYHFGMAEPAKRPWYAEHADRYIATGGEDGHDWNHRPTRCSRPAAAGRARIGTTPLIYGRDGYNDLLVASQVAR